jgi:hypothetical protein
MTLHVYLPCTVMRVGWPWLPVIPIRKLEDRGQYNDTVRLIEDTLRPIAEELPRRKGYSVPSVLELGIPLGVWKGPRLRIKHA